MQTIEIDRPVRTVYDQWTQFESFPRFMDHVEAVRQIDESHVHWKVAIAGIEREWDAEITEQVPDRVVAWRATDGTRNGGHVDFEPLGPSRTRISLELEMDPQGFAESIADWAGIPERSAARDLERFREFLDQVGSDPDGYRGEIHGGRPD